MEIHVDVKKRVWLSCDYLESMGITNESIRQWKCRNIHAFQYIDNRAFIAYNTIPKPTRKKLYSEEAYIQLAKEENKNRKVDLFYNQLKQSYSGIAAAKWRNLIQEQYPQLTDDQLTEFSRKAAVIENCLNLYPHLCGHSKALLAAYLRIYPGAYSKTRFSIMLSNAKEHGVISVAVDHRTFNNPKPVHGDDLRYWAAYILNHNKAFSLKIAYEEYFCAVCEKEGYKTPSYNWFLMFYKENQNTLDRNRYGQKEYERMNQNYAKITAAQHAGSQWQIDGWEIPIYCKEVKDGKTTWFKYNLFAVKDAHSRKIIGFDIARSENTQSILKGLENAVKNTLTLPYEIVADNHSFNKTKEAGNFKEELERLGVKWTTDSNPRRKAILERGFKALGVFFKKHYGYIGQGITTKEKGGRTQKVLIDQYIKAGNTLDRDQIFLTTISVINEYNSTKIKSLGDSPNNLYAKSEQPHSVKVDNYKRLQLFTRKTEHKVSHGQITIQKGFHKYEYQLPAEYSHKYNNQTVSVRYEDFDTIYLFDRETDEPICRVDQKQAIHGALADQTDKDRELLLKNKGRIQGINFLAKKQKQLLYKNAAKDHPEAFELVNLITAPKDLVQQLRTDFELRRQCYDHDVNPDTVTDWPKESEMLDQDMKPPKQKENRHPFQTESTIENIYREKQKGAEDQHPL